jgi:hypothetical protein
MLETMLALTGLAFWTVAIGTVIFCLIIMALVEFNRPFWATFLVILTTTVFVYATKYPLWDEVRNNPLLLFYWTAGFLLAGAGWSLFKWWRHVDRVVKSWAKRGYTDDLRKLEKIKAASSDSSVDLPYEIDPGHNKDRFFGWIVYWPFSLVWTLLDDPLRAAFEFMYDQFGQFYTKIAQRVARRIASTVKIPS